MFVKLREKLRCFRKGLKGSDTEENPRPTKLPQRSRDEAVPECSKFKLETTENSNVERPVDDTKHLKEKIAKGNLKARRPDQQNEFNRLEEAEHDGVDVDVSHIRKQHPKGTGLEKDLKPDDPEIGPRPLHGLKDDNKKDEAKTPEYPVSETMPAGEKAVERSKKPGNAGLWQRAFDELNEDLKGRLCEDKALPLENAIKEVIDETKKNFEAYQNGGLKFKNYDGKEVNVRDVAKKILNSAIHCSEIVKWIAAFDPSGHASSAWAIVSLGLTMAKNLVNQKEAAFKSSEFLADILARYVILDHYCHTEKLPSSDGLDNAIVQVYKAILEYTAEVKKRQSPSFLNRMGNSIFPDTDTELAHLRSTVEDQNDKVRDWSQIHTLLYQSTKGDEMIASIEKVYQNTETIKVKVNSDETHKILEWLSKIEYSPTQDDHQRVRTDNTGDWLLYSNEYKQWKYTPGNIFWLYGPAGCGKSILCSTIIQDIKRYCDNASSSKLSYWYFQFNRSETQNVKNMTRTIIRQLLPEELPTSLVSLWKEHSRKNCDPDQDELSKVLNDVIESHMGDRLFLIFDALDECPDNEIHERDLLLRLLKDLIDKHRSKVHLLATSRVEEDIRCHLEQSLKLDLEDRMNDDVEAFVHNALDQGKLKRWKKNEQVKHEILAKLLNTHEQRHFGLTHLQIERLGKCKKEAKIMESLKEMPKSLEKMYHKIFQEIPEDEQEDARSILIWLSFALTPLELETVAAVMTYPDPEDVVKTCTTSLVTVSPSDGTIKLAHFSVKEFLVVSNPIHWYQFTTIGGHMDIANRALDDLLDKTEVLTKESADGLPLLKYAAKYWDGHFSEISDSDIQFPGLEEKICRLFENEIFYFNWRRVAQDNFWLHLWDIDNDIEAVEPPIYMACRMGLQSAVERLLLQGAEPFTIYRDLFVGLTTFDVAIWNGHLTILKQLFENIEISAEIAQNIVNAIGCSGLSHAELEAILNFILDTEVLYDESANGCALLNENFIIGIAKSRWESCRLMDLLLDKQEKIEVPVTERVLQAVVEKRDCGEEMMRVLCNRRRKDIQITEELMETVARNSGLNPGVSTLVLQHFGASAPLNQMIITHFVQKATPEVMELFLQIRGNEIQVTEEFLVTAAKYQNSPEVFHMLWKRAPGIEITGKLLWNIALQSKGLGYIEFLLEECHQGDFIDDGIVQNAAASSGNIPLMRILLDKRETGVISFHVSQATLMAAASNRFFSQRMMELVINNADSEISINEEILCLAAGNFNPKSTLKYLIEMRGDLPITEEVLVSAAANFNAEGALELLFARFPDAPVTDRVFGAAGVDSRALSLLLKRGRNHVQVCQLIARLLEQDILSLWMTGNLLREELIELDGNLINAVGVPKALVVAFCKRSAMEKLLDLQGNDITLTEELMLEALHTVEVDPNALELLISRLGSAVPITEKILASALLDNGLAHLDLLLKEGRNLHLQKVWDVICQSNNYFGYIGETANILLEYGEIDVSQTMLEFLPLQEGRKNFGLWGPNKLIHLWTGRDLSAPAIKLLLKILFVHGDADTIQNFINQLRSKIPITEKIWDALWQTDECSFKYKVIISNILLQHGKFDVSQTLLKFLPEKKTKEGFSGEELDNLVDIYAKQDISTPATKMVAEILFEFGSTHTIRKFFRHTPTIQLTDDLIRIAEQNERANKKVLMRFLNAKRAADQNIPRLCI